MLIDGMESSFKNANGLKQFTVAFKIHVVEDYLRRANTRRAVAEHFGMSIGSLDKWVRLYKEGKLKVSNAISVSHRVPLKAQTNETGSLTLVEYIKPLTVMYEGKEYIVKG